jgi:hypothetical protein
MTTRLAALLIVGALFGTLQSCADAGAVSTAPGRIDQVRLGFGLDQEGRVSPGCAASTFALHDPIHLSMQVSDARPGSVLQVAVRNVATRRTAWSEKRSLTPGRSSLTFEIPRNLAVGRYRAEPSLDGVASSARVFVVQPQREGVR